MSSEDSEPELPQSRSRRVSFADVKGLSLVSVKKFDSWDIPKLRGCESLEGDGKEAEEYYLSSLFTLPMPSEEMAQRVREQKMELESIELLPGTTILRGIVRVLNISYDKMVYVRTSLDTWASHFDLLAEYIPGSSDGVTDCFSFKLTLVPFGTHGARVDFCLRYETPIGTFWANNDDKNYVVFCHPKVEETRKIQQKDKAQKKSCLKTVSQIFATEELESSTNAEPSGVPKHNSEMPLTNIQNSGTNEVGCQEILVEESSLNCSQKRRRRAARLARVKDYFSQRDNLPKENQMAAVDLSQSQREEDTLPGKNISNGPEFQSQPLEHRNFDRMQKTSDSLATSNMVTSLRQDRPSQKDSEKSNNVSIVSAASSALGEEKVPVISDKLSEMTDQHTPPCQNANKSCRMVESAMIQMKNALEKERDESASTSTGFSDDVADTPTLPVSQTNSFTFGTVRAPLYHQVFGTVENYGQNVIDGRNTNEGSLTMKCLFEGYSTTGIAQSNSFTNEGDCSSSFSLDFRETHSEESDNHRDPLESNSHCLTLALLNPVSEVANGSVHKTSTCPECVASTGQIPNDSLGHKGASEADNLPDQYNSHFHVQIPPDAILAQTKSSAENTTSAPKQSLQDTSHPLVDTTCTQATLLQAQTHPVSVKSRAEVIPRGSFGVASEFGTAEWSSGTNTKLDKPTAIPKLTDANIIVLSSTMDTANHSINGVTSMYTVTQNIFAISDEKDDPVFVKDLTPSEEKESDEVKKVVQSDSLYSETSLSTEVEDSGSNGHTGDDRSTTNVSNSKEEQTQGKHVEDHNGPSKDNNVYEGQMHDNQNIEEKDWEQIVEEEEEDVFIDEGGETWIIQKESKRIGVVTNIDGRFEKVPEEQEVYIKEENMVEKEKAEETIDEEKEEEEKTVVHATEVKVEKELNVMEEEIEEDEEEEIKVGNKNDEILVEEYRELPVEEGKMLKEDKEMVNGEGAEEMLVESETVKKVETGEKDECTQREQISCEGQKEAADNILMSEQLKSTFESGTVVERTNANNTKNTDAGENRCEWDIANIYIERAPPHNDEVIYDSLLKEEMDTANGDGPYQAHEPASKEEEECSNSNESLSDDEMELYMHSLRASQKHSLALATAASSKDIPVAMSVGRRPSITRSKQLPSPMPSISESVDEETPNNALEDLLDFEMVDEEPIPILSTVFQGKDDAENNVVWWRETFSMHNICKMLLYTLLIVVFFIVAYHYDFLACFTLYLFSVLWLFCQGEKQLLNDNKVKVKKSPQPVTRGV